MLDVLHNFNPTNDVLEELTKLPLTFENVPHVAPNFRDL